MAKTTKSRMRNKILSGLAAIVIAVVTSLLSSCSMKQAKTAGEGVSVVAIVVATAPVSAPVAFLSGLLAFFGWEFVISEDEVADMKATQDEWVGKKIAEAADDGGMFSQMIDGVKSFVSTVAAIIAIAVLSLILYILKRKRVGESFYHQFDEMKQQVYGTGSEK